VKIQVLWAAMPCCCVNSEIIFRFHPEDEGMKALQSFKTCGTIHPVTQHNIPQ